MLYLHSSECNGVYYFVLSNYVWAAIALCSPVVGASLGYFYPHVGNSVATAISKVRQKRHNPRPDSGRGEWSAISTGDINTISSSIPDPFDEYEDDQDQDPFEFDGANNRASSIDHENNIEMIARK